MATVKEINLIKNFFKEEEIDWNLLKENFENYGISNKIWSDYSREINPYKLISNGFDFSKTKEGVEFWSKLNTKWINYLLNKK